MNILIITKYKHPHIGGVEKHIYNTSKILAKNHTLTTISSDDINTKNIKFLGLLLIWFELFKFIKLIKRSDIVHIHDVFIWYLPYMFLFPRKKVVLTQHGWEGKYPIPFKNKIIKKLGNKLADTTISVGEYIDKYYKTKSDYVIWGGVKQPSIKSRSLDVTRDDRVILYIGRLEKDTGLPILLYSAESLLNNGYKLQFLGDGKLKAECQKYGKVLGFKKDINKYLAQSEVVFASGYLTILESFSHKCKVIAAYDNPLKKDYYELSPYGSHMLLVKSSENLDQKLKSHKFNVQNAYKLTKKYSWEKIADLYEEIYSFHTL